MTARAARSDGARTVRDAMKPQVVTVVPEMTVRELVQTFVEERVRGAPVLDPAGKVIGVVGETDVLRMVLRADAPRRSDDVTRGSEPGAHAGGEEAGCGLDSVRVGEIMGPVGAVFAPGEPLARVARTFAADGVQRAVVVENGILLGIVTPADLMQIIWAESPASERDVLPSAALTISA